MDMRYEAVVDTDNGPQYYTYEETVKTKGAAWACGLTAIFYGGACWGYLGQPYESSEKQLRSNAINELKEKYGVANPVVRSENIHRLSWTERPKTSLLTPRSPANASN